MGKQPDVNLIADEDNMVRLPFIYYHPEKLSKIIREGGLVDSSVAYTTEEYTAPKKGFKLHPAHSQHSRGKAHKPLYLLAFEGNTIAEKICPEESGSVLQQPMPDAVRKGAIHRSEPSHGTGAQRGGKGADGERERGERETYINVLS